MHPSDEESDNLDNVAYNPGDLPFEVRVEDLGSSSALETIRGAGVVLGGPTFEFPKLSQQCREAGVPCVNNLEHSFRTRLEIAQAEPLNVLRRARRFIWEFGWERICRESVRAAAGLQCNGTPAYDDYAKRSRDALLYFDSRVRPSDLITEAALATRLQELRRGNPLRLAFSGRLVPIKGALDLIGVASALKRLGVRFHFDIYGDGQSRPAMALEIEKQGLQDCVELHGAVDFRTELLPSIKSSTDVFVCCHRQGDPSCTYLETMACGTPIVGFSNEAFRGMIARAPVGWAVRMGDTKGLAKKIAALDADRETVATTSAAALEFATSHTLDKVFAARIEHLARLAKPARAPC
jgi:glycosyltransferase involved in cell wall biosynthesis